MKPRRIERSSGGDVGGVGSIGGVVSIVGSIDGAGSVGDVGGNRIEPEEPRRKTWQSME